MTFFTKKNNVSSLITDSPLAAGATTVNVTTGEGSNFPSTFPFLCTIYTGTISDDSGMEIVQCTGRTGDVLIIIRAQEGTSDVEHSVGETIAMLITAGLLQDSTYGIEGNITTHIADTSTHGVAEVADVATVSTEIDTDISTHSVLDTGVHGAGVSTLATAADIATHTALPNAHHNEAHLLGSHTTDTLANLNAKVTDATLIDTADSRLSDDRDPTAHAAEHTNGTDDIQSATNLVKGLATAAHITAIEANTSKDTNATHTGDVTGDEALTVDPTAISGKGTVTALGSDYVLIGDTSDAGALKKSLISDFASAGGDMAASTYDPTTIAASAFDMDNMVEGVTTKILTGTERTKLTSVDTDADVTGDNAPQAHLLGSHTTDTLANLNAKVTDATLIDTADSRLSDARTPTAHETSHKTGGSDEILLDEFGTPTDNTNLNFTTALHGLVPKGTNVGDYLKDDGTWSTPGGAGDVLNGGNAFGANMSIGTTDNYTLALFANGIEGLIISNTGNVTMGYALSIDTIIEETSDNGVVIEGIKLEDKTILVDSAPDADVTVSGTIANESTGSIAAFGDLLYLESDGEWTLADADAEATMPGLRMAIGATTDGGTADLLSKGYARNDAWNWIVGDAIYASCTGTTTNTLTQTAPAGVGDQVQIVGIATHADRMFFNPNDIMIEISDGSVDHTLNSHIACTLAELSADISDATLASTAGIETLSNKSISDTLDVDTIDEYTADAGVTIEGILFENNEIKTDDLHIKLSTSYAYISEYLTASNSSGIKFNVDGYDGGATYFREFYIYNGKGSVMLKTHPVDDILEISSELMVGEMKERVLNAGITIETVTLEDGALGAVTTLDMSGALTVDTINEHTTDAGVTIEGVKLEDDTILLDSTPDATATVSGILGNETTGVIAAFGDVLYNDGTDWNLAKADASTTMPGLRMAIGATTDGSSYDLLIQGYARDDTWTWTVGGAIYVSITGTTGNTLTQTTPNTTGDQVQKVGYATHADRMYFGPDLTIIEVA